jgi:tRNA/rRNA methyltransferase
MRTGPPPPAQPLQNVVVVLVRTEGSLNVGSVARVCGNFGASLRLVDVKAETAVKEAWRMAHPSVQLLDDAPRLGTLQEALADCELAVATSGKIAEAIAGPPLDVARARGLLPATGKLALVFGNERTGLALEEAALCHRVLRLPARGAEDSMNLSHAVCCALTVFSLAAIDDVEARASASAREQLLLEWGDALEAAGFYRATPRPQFAPRLAEIVSKMDVSERDVAILRGMFARFAKVAQRAND